MPALDATQHSSMPAADAPQHSSLPAPDAPQRSSMPAPDAPQHSSMPAADAPQHPSMPAADAPQRSSMPAADAPQLSSMPAADATQFSSMPRGAPQVRASQQSAVRTSDVLDFATLATSTSRSLFGEMSRPSRPSRHLAKKRPRRGAPQVRGSRTSGWWRSIARLRETTAGGDGVHGIAAAIASRGSDRSRGGLHRAIVAVLGQPLRVALGEHAGRPALSDHAEAGRPANHGWPRSSRDRAPSPVLEQRTSVSLAAPPAPITRRTVTGRRISRWGLDVC